MNQRKFHRYGFAGLALIIAGGIGLILEWGFFETFMTPVCWTGLILFLDSVNYSLSGNSLMMTRRREFLWMLPWSIALWYFFEFYNLFIRNWYYIGLPENLVIRYFGYFWSFATIWPGVYEIYELLKNLNIPAGIKVKPFQATRRLRVISVLFGLCCMLLPFFVSPRAATYMAAPVWIGMVFFLDPLNYYWKSHSFWKDWSTGDLSTLIRLFLTGILAGGLWEFWNYWATAKWIYEVPLWGDVKIFEMPVLGYLGFPPFAVEVFVMWEVIKHLLKIK